MYYSGVWLRKNVLMQTDDDIAMIDDQIRKEGLDAEAEPGPPEDDIR